MTAALAALLLAATLGEGGAVPWATLLVHGAIALLLLVDRGGDHRPSGPAWAAFAAFCGLALAGAVLAPYAYGAILVLLEIAAFAVVAVLAARRGPDLPGRLALPLLAGAAAQGLLALAQRLGGEARPAGTFLNPSHLAAWLVAVLLLSAALWPCAGRRRALVLALGVPAAAGLLLTGSRGGALALLAGGAWLAGRRWASLSPRARRGAMAGGLALAVVAGAVFATRLRERDPLQWRRASIWAASLRMAADAPLTGTGPGQFATAAARYNFPLAAAPMRFARSFGTAHSDLLRALAEFGIPAALALLAAAALAIRGRGTPAADAALIALAVQSGLETLTERPAVFLLAAALLGARLSAPRAAPAVPRRLRLAAIAVPLVLVAEVGPYLAWTRGSVPLNPLHPAPYLRRAERLLPREAPVVPERYAEARELAETAVRLQPADPRYRVGLARIEGRACRDLFRDVATRARASAAYAAAEALAPFDAVIPVEHAGMLLSTGDPDGAAAAARRSIALEPEAVLPRMSLAEALDRMGLADEAAAARREAEERAARWAGHVPVGPYERILLSRTPSSTAANSSAIRTWE